MRTPAISRVEGRTTATEPLAARPGQPVLGRYRLVRRLGAGGFGVVWSAYDEKLERDVAVKVIPRGDGRDERSRVEREALAAARLNHPGIVALYEMGWDDHDAYLVSELVHGAALEELLRERAVSDRDVARIGVALYEALEHAHGRGVIHRDVKPANVMVLSEPSAGAGFAKLTDFGIAQLAGGEALTATGDVVGTLAYMAPEQAEGRGATTASDVYSLALTLYEAWTGSNPVRAESPAATARRLGRPLPPLRSRRPELPPVLAEAVDAALDPDPDFRPLPGELREVLHHAQASLSDAGGLVEPETLERFGLTAAAAPGRLRRLFRRGRRKTGAPLAIHQAPDAAPRTAPRAVQRLATGMAAAGLVAAALGLLGPQPPVSSVGGGIVAGLVVAALPRAGWILSALAVCLWLASAEGAQPGTALVLAVVLLSTPLLLPRAGLLWSLPALAPLLGTVGIAPLFVGIAALAPTATRRAGVAAAGFLWLAAAEALAGRELLFGAADGTHPRGEWESSALAAAGDALLPLASSPALAPLVVWVAFATLLPIVVRGRFAALDLAAAALWAALLVLAHEALGDLLAATTPLDRARGAVAGACLGAIVAVAVLSLAPPPRGGARDPALP